MNGNGWNNMSPTDFSQGQIPNGNGPHAFADNRHIPYQMPEYYANNPHTPHQMLTYYVNNQHIPHPMPTYYADNRHIPHQAPAQYVDNRNLPHQIPSHHFGNMHLSHQIPTDNRHLPHPTPTHYVDNRHVPHQSLVHYVDNMNLPHQTPTHHVDNMHLSHQIPTDNRHLPHPMPTHYADNRHIPHQVPTHYVDNRNLPHQIPMHHVDNMHLSHPIPTDNRHLPHPTPTHYADNRNWQQQKAAPCADNRHLPHPTPEHYADNRHLPLPTPAHYAEKRHLSHQTAEHCTDIKLLPHQTVEQCTDNKHLPNQTPVQYEDKMCLPHQKTKDLADKMHLPNQNPEDCAANKCLPHKTPDPNADKRQLPQQTSEAYADKRQLPHQTSEHSADKNLSQQTPEDCADKKCLPQQTPEDCANNKCLPPLLQCEICELILNPKCMEIHMKGLRHRKRVLQLDKQSTEHKTSSGEESIHNRSSQISKEAYAANKCLSHQTPDHYADKRQLSQQASEACADKRQLSQQTPEACADNVPAEMSKRKVGDNTDAKDHGFKHEIEGATQGKYMKMNNGIRSVKNDQPQSTPVELKASAGSNIIAEKKYITCDFAATVIPQGPVASHAFTPPAVKNHIDLPREVNEAQEHHKVQKCGVETNDYPQSISMELKALGGCNISTVAEYNSSDSDAIVIALPQGVVTSQVLSPSPAAGSSFEPPNQINSQIDVEEGTELHEVQNHSVETNVQPQSISMEFHGTAGSDINTSTEGTCSDSGAIIIAPPQSPIAYEVSTPVAVIQTGMSDSKVHNEIQNLIVDSNNQQHSISLDLHVAGSITNNQTEVVNSDSTSVEIYKEPLASLLPDAVGSSFEPVTEHGLDTETEPHLPVAILDIESQHLAEETDIELLPPVSMEIDVALEVGAETKTEDGNSQAEMKMDVDLFPESVKTKVLKVSVCLTCGDEGFEEAIVYCSKCGDYVMHRYCLAGPVVFTDKVTWFCVDCEEVVVEADHPNNETSESEKDEVVFDPQPIADPVWRGSLQVFNKSFDKISGFMGHLSTLACPKVLEEARHLPDVLYANLLQRSAVWPESFKKFGTNNQSIGLYFFPENESVERYYDLLVDEMISNDLAIRVWVEKTELLIFPSTLLPRQYKRFQSKYYLWGIFKRKQASCTIKDT